MSPTPPDTTIRYKVGYTGPFGSHHMLFHGVTGATLSDLRDSVQNIITAMSGACWNTTTFNEGQFALAGNTFFSLDVSWTTITRSSGTNPAATDAPSHFAQWGGRTPGTAKRAKYYLFETVVRDNDTMRYAKADDPDVSAVIDALEAEAAVIAAIDGEVLAFYQYANVGQNDHLTHKARA